MDDMTFENGTIKQMTIEGGTINIHVSIADEVVQKLIELINIETQENIKAKELFKQMLVELKKLNKR